MSPVEILGMDGKMQLKGTRVDITSFVLAGQGERVEFRGMDGGADGLQFGGRSHE